MQGLIHRAAFAPMEDDRIDRDHGVDPLIGNCAVEGEISAAAPARRNERSLAALAEKIECGSHVVILRGIVKNLLGHVFDRRAVGNIGRVEAKRCHPLARQCTGHLHGKPAPTRMPVIGGAKQKNRRNHLPVVRPAKNTEKPSAFSKLDRLLDKTAPTLRGIDCEILLGDRRTLGMGLGENPIDQPVDHIVGYFRKRRAGNEIVVT